MSALSLESRHVAFAVYSLLVFQECGYGFECYSEYDVLSVAYSSLYTSAMVGFCGDFPIFYSERVVLLATSHRDTCKSVTILKSLCGINA